MSRIYLRSLQRVCVKARVCFASELKLFKFNREIMSQNQLSLPGNPSIHTVSKLEMTISSKDDSSSLTSVALTELMESKTSSNLIIEVILNPNSEVLNVLYLFFLLEPSLEKDYCILQSVPFP